jgi:hypothetical protein
LKEYTREQGKKKGDRVWGGRRPTHGSHLSYHNRGCRIGAVAGVGGKNEDPKK